MNAAFQLAVVMFGQANLRMRARVDSTSGSAAVPRGGINGVHQPATGLYLQELSPATDDCGSGTFDSCNFFQRITCLPTFDTVDQILHDIFWDPMKYYTGTAVCTAPWFCIAVRWDVRAALPLLILHACMQDLAAERLQHHFVQEVEDDEGMEDDGQALDHEQAADHDQVAEDGQVAEDDAGEGEDEPEGEALDEEQDPAAVQEEAGSSDEDAGSDGEDGEEEEELHIEDQGEEEEEDADDVDADGDDGDAL